MLQLSPEWIAFEFSLLVAFISTFIVEFYIVRQKIRDVNERSNDSIDAPKKRKIYWYGIGIIFGIAMFFAASVTTLVAMLDVVGRITIVLVLSIILFIASVLGGVVASSAVKPTHVMGFELESTHTDIDE